MSRTVNAIVGIGDASCRREGLPLVAARAMAFGLGCVELEAILVMKMP